VPGFGLTRFMLGMAGACSLLASPELSFGERPHPFPIEKGQRNADPFNTLHNALTSQSSNLSRLFNALIAI